MPELAVNLDKLLARLDRMGLRVRQAIHDAIAAARSRNIEAGREVELDDSVVDREEVAIEQECIRLFALYQPTAVDMRSLCFVIHVNHELERMGDIAARIGREVRYLVTGEVLVERFPGMRLLIERLERNLDRTTDILRAPDAKAAEAVIDADNEIDDAYHQSIREIIESAKGDAEKTEAVLALTVLARAMERIGDHCTNIAEDAIFLETGNIVRHQRRLNHSAH